MLEEDRKCEDILIGMDVSQTDAELLHLAHKLVARRDETSWLKNKLEAIIYADEKTNTRRAERKEKN